MARQPPIHASGLSPSFGILRKPTIKDKSITYNHVKMAAQKTVFIGIIGM
jgi:hypothetical protein